jgi:forespore regulator of the sigma-K checkpoint
MGSMSYSNLIRELKRRLKLRKRWLTLGILLLVVGVTFAMIRSTNFGSVVQTEEALHVWGLIKPAQDPEAKEQERLLNTILDERQARTVDIRKQYVCGEELTSLGLLSPDEIVQYKSDHPRVKILIGDDGHVTFFEQIDDLSPACKMNSYFGLDHLDNLSLFHDVPGKEQVLRTFFQLNVERIRSSLPSEVLGELKNGIQIHDLAEYNSVLSTFSEFAIGDPATTAARSY